MHLLWRVFGRHSPWPRRFLGWCARALGVRARIIGERVEGAALFASNHLSWLDILLVGGATGASFVSKDSVRNWPVAGRLATMVGTIYITAEDRRAAGAQVFAGPDDHRKELAYKSEISVARALGREPASVPA
ncbi:MAG: 1-acyl-sn-glycerol-3-phosphate acyltransferase [Sphingomonadales bacterium]|nr:1-acyl-sn-glycerol-3-phosphate acyltransferase [Sphingomonadales bacterium]